MKMRLTITALCCCIAAAASAADVYKWKDAQGHVHYGDQAKQGSEKLKIGAPATEEPADTKAQRAKTVETCGRKRDQLMTYQNAVRVVEKDALGNEKEYSDTERQKLIQLTQKQIADQCKDVPEEKPKASDAQ